MIDKKIIKKINFFINSNKGTKIKLNTKETLYYNYSAYHFLNYLCIVNLTNIKSYNHAVKKMLNFHYLIPIVLNNISIIPFSRINKYETIFINYNNIYKTLDLKDKIEIYFLNNERLIINKTFKFYNSQLNKMDNVKRYLFKL